MAKKKKSELTDAQNIILALEELEEERGINKDLMIDALEQALISAYKKNFGSAQNVRVEIDRETGGINVYSQRTVVDESDLYDNFLEIELSEARKISPNYELNDIIEEVVTPKDFGRIAAQAAKQLVIQKIREAERENVYNEFIEKEGEIVTGEVVLATQKPKNVFVNIGRVGKIEALMTESEQIKHEEYKPGKKLKVYIVSVKKNDNKNNNQSGKEARETKKTKGTQIIVSRTHPDLVKRLFEMEVEEILKGIVTIKSISREAGSRTKIAVQSLDPQVDPIGACVGAAGARVRAVVEQLGGEKIDIIKYSDDPSEYISAALSPSKVESVELNEEEKTALVVVPDDKLSLAIGKEGQNARLAAKLTGWKIDIKSKSQAEKELNEVVKTTEIDQF